MSNRGIAWAFLHPDRAEINIIAIMGDQMLRYWQGEWHGDTTRLESDMDTLAMWNTKAAERDGMELVIGPVDFTAPEAATWDYQALAAKVMTTLWLERPICSRQADIQAALSTALTQATNPKFWTSTSGVY